MTQTGMKPMVLARFPVIDLADRGEAPQTIPDSRGRLFGQALSFKLLAASVLVLVVGAVVPWSLKQKNTSDSSASEPAVTWQSRPPKAAIEPTPVCVAAAPASVSAPQAPATTPRVASRPQIITSVPAAATTTTGASLMSAWPNREHPIPSPTEAKTNQPMVVRP